MKKVRINAGAPDAEILVEASHCLNASGVIAHATETVYGLAAHWNDWEAIQKLCGVKQRPLTQPYSIMVDRADEIIEIIGWDSPPLRRLLTAIFPGPLTLLLPRRRQFALDYWNQFEDIGFRLPEHRLSRELIKRAGTPLITTSANLSGEASPASAAEISKEIINAVDLVLDSGECPYKIPSTIIKVSLDKRNFNIIRTGAFPVEQFTRIFKTIW